MSNVFSIKIAGPAGTGVKSVGNHLFRSLIHSGYFCFAYPEYPSLIRGGHNTFLITIRSDNKPINSETVDLLLPLTTESLKLEKTNINKDTIVICDQDTKIDFDINNIHQPPLSNIAIKAGNPLVLNTAILAFICHQLSLDSNYSLTQVLDSLEGKNEKILEQNKTAFGQALALSGKYHLKPLLPDKNNLNSLILNVNQAIGLGAIMAGLNFYSGYPMTPSSPLLHFLAKNQTKYNYIVHHAEDEIAAVNMAIGASFVGARSMTATSGGGFALMQESISLSGMLELPLVISLAQRAGPATGLPTWTSQSDLLFAIHSGHGEFPKIVMAPSDPEEAYYLTHKAFQLSQDYQIPVIILTDKYLVESFYVTNELDSLLPTTLSSVIYPPKHSDQFYSRYQSTPTGIKARTLPGMKNGEYIANSDEHDQFGLVNESSANRLLQNTRRQNKTTKIKEIIPPPQITDNSSSALISWGSHKHIVAQVALENNLSHIHFSYVWPLPNNLDLLLENYQNLIVVENNITAQFAAVLASETGIKANQTIGNDTGRPLTISEITKKLNNK